MNNETYVQTQQHLIALAGIVKDMPLMDFISKINICETVAPMIDPTLYMEGTSKLTFIKRIAESAQNFQKDVIKYEQALKGSLSS